MGLKAYIKKVRIEGLEPTRLAAPEPKPGTSTNFAISAYVRRAAICYGPAKVLGKSIACKA